MKSFFAGELLISSLTGSFYRISATDTFLPVIRGLHSAPFTFEMAGKSKDSDPSLAVIGVFATLIVLGALYSFTASPSAPRTGFRFEAWQIIMVVALFGVLGIIISRPPQMSSEYTDPFDGPGTSSLSTAPPFNSP